jgi:hypothetical protein
MGLTMRQRQAVGKTVAMPVSAGGSAGEEVDLG